MGIIADTSPALIRKIADAGHEIASHGYAHRRIFDMDPGEFENDLVRSKIAIEKAAGLLMLSVCAALCVVALIGAYAILIVIVFATIFYWPWRRRDF